MVHLQSARVLLVISEVFTVVIKCNHIKGRGITICNKKNNLRVEPQRTVIKSVKCVG